MSDWARVIDLASSDSIFRSKLKNDAVAACRDVGCQLTPGNGIRVIEQGLDEVHFVLGSPTIVPEIDALLERAESDLDLRQQLLENATPILNSVAGKHFPVETRFFVHQRRTGETLILLRDIQEAGELDESQLESIAGGLSQAAITPRRPDNTNGIIAILIG